MQKEIKYIDIKKIISESNSLLLKKLPGFVVKLIIIIVRQDSLNRILNKYSGEIGKDFLPRIIEELNLKLEIEGMEKLPENGKCFFVANHPFGIVDGLVLTRIITQKYGKVKSIANEGFMLIPQLHPFIAAVSVFERSSREYLTALEVIYKQDVPISHFPAGEVSRRYGGRIQDKEWQKSFVSKAVSSKRDVVPIFFHGRNSNLFYLIYVGRHLFGIKTNLELALLPGEMFKKRNKTIRVTIGDPISYKIFDKSLTHHEWAQKIKSEVYNLGA